MSNFDNGVNTAMQTAGVTATQPTSNGQNLVWSNYGGALLWVRGFNGDTVTFEASMDGVTWYSTRATSLASGTFATTATVDGLYFVSGPGVNFLRARITTYSAGSINVNGVPTFQSNLF